MKSVITLTNTRVGQLASRARSYILYDSKLPGFGCRVSPSGAKSWTVEYRPFGGGRAVAKRRLTLGSFQAITADQARKAAAKILAQARLGNDPAEERASRRRSLTVEELATRYMAEEIRPTRKVSTAALYADYFRLHVVPEIGRLRAIDVTKSVVARLHRTIGEETPVTANRVLVLISGLYSWAASVGETPEGLRPTQGITKYREQGRERFLTLDELARLGAALRIAQTDGLPWEVDESRSTAKHAPKESSRRVLLSAHSVAAIRLLLLTGCRLREVLHLRWHEVDLQRGMLFLHDSKSGRKPVYLCWPAVQILEELPKTAQYVIAGNDPDRPRSDLHRPWAAIARFAELKGVRLHDLRHSFAAIGAGSGLGLPIIGKLLGHRNLETTSRYAHLDVDPVRRAVDCIGEQVIHALDRTIESGAVFARVDTAVNNLQASVDIS